MNRNDNIINTQFTEKKILQDIKNLDTKRDFINFFSSSGYQNGIYLVSFVSYNELPVQYVAFYTKDLRLLAYLTVKENEISIFSNKSEKLDTINGSFDSHIYINKQGY